VLQPGVRRSPCSLTLRPGSTGEGAGLASRRRWWLSCARARGWRRVHFWNRRTAMAGRAPDPGQLIGRFVDFGGELGVDLARHSHHDSSRQLRLLGVRREVVGRAACCLEYVTVPALHPERLGDRPHARDDFLPRRVLRHHLEVLRGFGWRAATLPAPGWGRLLNGGRNHRGSGQGESPQKNSQRNPPRTPPRTPPRNPQCGDGLPQTHTLTSDGRRAP
jgi:hypothetical protein